MAASASRSGTAAVETIEDAAPDTTTETTEDDGGDLFDREEEPEAPKTYVKGRDWTADQLETQYLDLLKAHRQRGDLLADDALIEIVKERQLKVGEGAPDAYDLRTETFTALGVEPNDEAMAPYLEKFKEAGFTQQQVEFSLQMFKAEQEAILAAASPHVDVKAEKATLEKEWGAEAPQRYRAVLKWASAKFGEDFLVKPPGRTAKTMMALDGLMTKEAGPTPLTQTKRGGFDETKANAAVDKIMRSPAYQGKEGKAAREAAQKEADGILKQIINSKKH